MLLIKVTLPPLDKYKHFQPANLLSIFSKIGSHIVLSLNLAPKGRPKYFIGRVPCLQPRTFSNKSISCTTPTGTNFDLPRFIFRLDIVSNQIRIIWRIKICSRSALQKNWSVICKKKMRHRQESPLRVYFTRTFPHFKYSLSVYFYVYILTLSFQTYQKKHYHFNYSHFLNIFPLNSPTFNSIEHSWSYNSLIKFSL